MGSLLELKSSSLWVRMSLHTEELLKPAVYIIILTYQCSVVSSLAACGDLIAAVFDFAHAMCALKLTEQQIALFCALVLINAGEINTPVFFHSCCILLFCFTI